MKKLFIILLVIIVILLIVFFIRDLTNANKDPNVLYYQNGMPVNNEIEHQQLLDSIRDVPASDKNEVIEMFLSKNLITQEEANALY